MSVEDTIKAFDKATNMHLAKVFICSIIGGAFLMKAACEVYEVGANEAIKALIKVSSPK